MKKEIFSESSKEKKRIRRKNKIFSDVRKARKMKKIEKVKKQIEGSILKSFIQVLNSFKLKNSLKLNRIIIKRMNSEMNNVSSGVTVTSLLLKTLENATKEYARECIRRCASYYGFESDEALLKLNLENCSIQVKEMKKRSAAAEPKPKTKSLKEKVVKVVKEAVLKASCPFPFGTCQISEEGCGGLSYNNGLFTQCQKEKMEDGTYCKVCQKEADASASGCPATGSVAERVRLGEGFRCPKGRAPVAYMKVMQKLKLDRSTVEAEAGKFNLTIDEKHFAAVEVEEKKEKAGRPKAPKKKVVSAETVEDLFALLVEEDDAETVIMTESEEEEEEEEEVDTRELEKSERNMMRSNESETKKVMAHEEKKQKEALRVAEKEKRISDELEAKEKRIADELAAKEAKKQQMIDDKVAKEANAILAKEQKIADEMAAKLAREQKAIDDLAAKEQKAIDDLAAKTAAKEKKIAEELAAKLAKEQKAINDLIEKEAQKALAILAKEQKAINDQIEKEAQKALAILAKEQKVIDDKLAKDKKIADELEAKEAKKQQLIVEKEAARVAKEAKLAEEQAAKDLKKKQLEDAKLAKSAKKVIVVTDVSPVVPVAVAVAVAVAAPKKVTVKRVTIGGKEYLKTVDNLLYDPTTREEMGIYDELTNTIKDLPDDDDDEISEDGYSTN